MQGPILVFAFMMATLVGVTSHLILGGDARRLALCIGASWLGFALGQNVGRSYGITWLRIGELHVFAALVGAFVVLVATISVIDNRTRRGIS